MSNLSSLFKMLVASSAVLGLAAVATAALADLPGNGFHVVNTPPPGDDPMYTFIYTDPSGDSAWGTLHVDAYGNAIGGSLNVTEGLAKGNYNLLPVSTTPPTDAQPAVYSPSGAFIFDDRVYATNQVPDVPALNVDGLLFVDAGGAEINIWGNSSDPDPTHQYTFYKWQLGIGYTVANGDQGTFALAIAPEGSSLMLLLPGLIPVALGARRRFRKR